MARFLAWTSAAALVVSLVMGCAESRPAEEATTVPSAASRPPALPAASLPPPAAEIGLGMVEDGLVAPVGLVSPGSEGDPSYVVDQTGLGDWSADWQTDQPTPRGSLLVSDPGPANAGAGAWAWRRLTLEERLDRFVTGLGEDAAGELYVMTRGLTGPAGLSGAVYRILPAP